jgi:hypothetical protein
VYGFFMHLLLSIVAGWGLLAKRKVCDDQARQESNAHVRADRIELVERWQALGGCLLPAAATRKSQGRRRRVQPAASRCVVRS